jgi:hypothetical protein
MNVTMRALLMMVRTVLLLLAFTFVAFGEASILRATSSEGDVSPDIPGMRRVPGAGHTVVPDFPGMHKAPGTGDIAIPDFLGMRKAPGTADIAVPDFPGMRKAPGPGDTVLPDFPGMRRVPGSTIPIRTWRLRIRTIQER